MPLYQYTCKKCKRFEDIYSNMMTVSSEDPIVGTKCTKCEKGKLSRFTICLVTAYIYTYSCPAIICVIPKI